MSAMSPLSPHSPHSHESTQLRVTQGQGAAPSSKTTPSTLPSTTLRPAPLPSASSNLQSVSATQMHTTTSSTEVAPSGPLLDGLCANLNISMRQCVNLREAQRKDASYYKFFVYFQQGKYWIWECASSRAPKEYHNEKDFKDRVQLLKCKYEGGVFDYYMKNYKGRMMSEEQAEDFIDDARAELRRKNKRDDIEDGEIIKRAKELISPDSQK